MNCLLDLFQIWITGILLIALFNSIKSKLVQFSNNKYTLGAPLKFNELFVLYNFISCFQSDAFNEILVKKNKNLLWYTDNFFFTCLWPLHYNWNIVESAVKHHNSNPTYLLGLSLLNKVESGSIWQLSLMKIMKRMPLKKTELYMTM